MHVVDDIAVDGYPYDAKLQLGMYPLAHSGSLINHSSTPSAHVDRIMPKGVLDLSPPLLIVRAGTHGIAAGMEITIKYGSRLVLQTSMRWLIGPHIDPNFRSLHQHGFVIYKDIVKTDDLLASIMDDSIYPLNGRGLPQSHKITDGTDAKRVMSKAAPTARWNMELRTRLTAAFVSTGLMVATDGTKVFCRMHAIKSFPIIGYDDTSTHWQLGDQGSAENPGHTDEHVNKMVGLRDEDMPLSVIVACMPNTRLRVLSSGWRILVMQPGDVLFFRGDLCHHGMGYASVNARVHCHLYSKFYTPFQPVSIHACPS